MEIMNRSPHFHARHLIKKLANGDYNYETSVSVDADSLEEIGDNLETLNRIVDGLARLECGRRKELDAWRADSDAQLENALAAAAKDGAR